MPAPHPASLGQPLLELEGCLCPPSSGAGHHPFPLHIHLQAALWSGLHQWATVPSASASVQPMGSPSGKREGRE